jgi:hypothetical protein
MPGPQSPAQNAPAEPSTTKPVDIGKAIGQFDSATVREKVRKWHTTGGGVLVADDGIPEESEKEEGTNSGSKSTSSESKSASASHKRSRSAGPQIVDWPKAPDRTSNLSQQEPSTEPSKPSVTSERRPRSNKLDLDLQEATAPKKRIISDGHWVRRRPPPKEKSPSPKPKPKPKPDVQLAWIRPPLLPRPPLEPEPPSPPKPPKEIRVYAARPAPSPRKQSFASSSDEARPRGLKDDTPVHRIVSPGTPQPRSVERERRSSTREKFVRSEENLSSNPHGSSRRRRKSAQEDSYLTSPESRRKSKASLDSPSSPETEYKPKRSQRRRRTSSHEDLRNGYTNGVNRQSSIQKSPPLKDFEFPRPKRDGHRRGRSEGEPLSAKAHERHHSDVEEHYIYSGRRKASYQEEFAKYAPEDRYNERRHSVRRRASERDSMEEPYEQDLPANPAPQTPKVSGNRVEAWLQGTPDPLESPSSKTRKSKKEERRVFSFETPQQGRDVDASTVDSATRISDPREQRTSSRKGSKSLRIDTEVSSSRQSARREKQRLPSPSEDLDPDIDIEYSSATSVPSLKRHGARRGVHSPTKERTKSPSLAASALESEVASSVVSSSVDASSFLPPDAPARHSAMGLPNRRLFPSVGKRLSTIASVETFNTKPQQASPSSVSEGSEATATPKAENNRLLKPLVSEVAPSEVSTARSATSLKRRLTTHADLISVLSMPRSKSKSIVSARSIRTHRSRLATATIGDLMSELASDETKYTRELKTLADGVILVLLKCVLSKSDAALAAGLYSRAPSSADVANATKLIRELGVALTRLKTLHNRIPKEDPDAFLNWATSAHKVYSDYVKTWRLGFEDVVVNLATDDDSTSTVSPARSVKGGAWDEGLPRNEEGYVVDGNGERVDVAFLLKRPLVRLKYLMKTVKGISIIKPSEKARLLANQFDELMTEARKRVNNEKARMEDEAAALIDPGRARDPRSLAPLSGVKVDPTRCVRARDYFDMHLPHSTGQAVDCRVELLLRDDAAGKGKSGDVLLCEVDNTGRWLFFPPIQCSRISARNGDEQGELVVMIRGVGSGGKEWQELLTLQSDDEEISSEWIELLGSTPLPPSLPRKASFSKSTTPVTQPQSSQGSSLLSASEATESTAPTAPLKSRTPSPREIEVPIGERAGERAKKWGYETPERINGPKSSEVSPITPPSEERSALGAKAKAPEAHQWPWPKKEDRDKTPQKVDRRPLSEGGKTPKDLNDAMSMAGSSSPALKRHKAMRYRVARNAESAPQSPLEKFRRDAERTPSPSAHSRSSWSSSGPPKPPAPTGFSVWLPSSDVESDSESDDDGDTLSTFTSSTKPVLSKRPSMHRRASSVPSKDLPSVPKLRQSTTPSTRPPPTKSKSQSISLPTPARIEPPASAPSRLRHKDPSKSPEQDDPPPPPPHRTPSATHKASTSHQFTPTPQLKRRSSSPLKHEYQPSTASETSSLSEYSDTDYSDSITSESSDDELEDDDLLSSLAPSVPPHQAKPPPPETIYSMPNASLKPSDSASQGPYRKVPEAQPQNSAKTIGSIFCWSDRGNWESLHPEDCSVVISPGLISAYEMSAAHSSIKENGGRPLIALELTPLVPIRRGTALDISIRSPPTPASRLKPGSNIMFRSRSPEECEALYTLINTARINNPTYIALQNARPPQGDSSWAAVMDRRNKDRTSSGGGKDSSWWQFGGSSRSRSYRASTKAASRSGNTESSVGTISSVMSAMKRFSGSGKFLSKLSTRDGESSGSAGSMRGGDSPPNFVDPSKAGDSGALPTSLGITNAKIRLYVRQTKGKWADLGSSRLSVLQKREPETQSDAGVDTPEALRTGSEKRILVTSKGNEVLLDATLGESCFERVARTGIAVSVWEDVRADGGHGVAATGGVGERRIRYYMIQVSLSLFLFSLSPLEEHWDEKLTKRTA